MASDIFVVSEVIYDTTMIYRENIDMIVNKLVISLYLNDKGIVLGRDPFIFKIYDSIKAANKLSKAHYITASVAIYDPETALRLSDAISVTPWLESLTPLSKDLMQQFGIF